MRRGRTDDNQTAIVQALRAIPGCAVRSTAGVGSGFPDLAVGFRGKTYLLEVKDGAKAASRRKLTDDEFNFLRIWTGHVALVNSVADALEAIGAV